MFRGLLGDGPSLVISKVPKVASRGKDPSPCGKAGYDVSVVIRHGKPVLREELPVSAA
jgi:hypothetical protein